MKLRIFQSAHGDCLLLESKDKKLVLCDGGMPSSIKSHVRGELGKLRDDERELEYVYISHIDSDHISGVLQLLEDEVEWRIFEYRQSINDANATEPDFPRPPVIKGLLNNTFRDLIGVNEETRRQREYRGRRPARGRGALPVRHGGSATGGCGPGAAGSGGVHS